MNIFLPTNSVNKIYFYVCDCLMPDYDHLSDCRDFVNAFDGCAFE